MHPISHEALLGPLNMSQSTLEAQSQDVAWIGPNVNFCVPPLSHEVPLGRSGAGCCTSSGATRKSPHIYAQLGLELPPESMCSCRHCAQLFPLAMRFLLEPMAILPKWLQTTLPTPNLPGLIRIEERACLHRSKYCAQQSIHPTPSLSNVMCPPPPQHSTLQLFSFSKGNVRVHEEVKSIPLATH